MFYLVVMVTKINKIPNVLWPWCHGNHYLCNLCLKKITIHWYHVLPY